jgi:signal transduction histidine kinase
MTPRDRARTAFLAAVVVLVLTGVLATSTLLRLRTSQDWVSHTRDVEKALAEVNFAGTRAAQFRAAYLDSGTPQDMQNYRAATDQILRKVHDVEALTRDNAAQQANARDLESVVRHRVQIMDEAISLKIQGEVSPEQRTRLNRELVDALAANNDVMERMAAEEQRLLEGRLYVSRRFFFLTVLVLAFAFLSTLALFYLYSRLLNTQLHAREHAEGSLRTLATRLLRIQDDERRRFSRELHDSIGQYLAAVKMNLAVVGEAAPGNPALAEAADLVDKASGETRTLSYLLHPPLLDEAGLPSAVKWYVEGFARRSGVQIQMDFASDLGRLPNAVEIALFRVIQEALTNIHRHAQAERAEIQIARSNSSVSLRIRDFGKGMAPRALERFRENSGPTGVGLAGMRERIAELGGQFNLNSDSTGTYIDATVPIGPIAAQSPLAS